MSLVVLKRKTEAKYKNNSVGYAQFSIEGTRRNQGYIGQDMRGRTILKTPFRNNEPRGSGGCCGLYDRQICVPYGTQTVEDSNVVKSSVLSNSGSIATHYRWTKRPAPFTSTKPDNNFILNSSQSSYIERLHRRVLSSIDLYNETHSTVPPEIPSTLPAPMNCPPITKNADPSMSQSLYIEKLDKACTLDVLPKMSISKTPLPGN